MTMDEELKNLQDWLENASLYELPSYKELPTVPLYMEQVTAYINKKSINSDPNQRATATTSQQIDKLKPIFMKIANEDGCEISDVLVRYMDLSSQAAAEKAAREQADTVDLGSLLKM